MRPIKFLALSFLLTSALPGQAADFSDPTWPCIQRKVETLSPGLMWPAPLDPDSLPADKSRRAAIEELAGLLTLRRLPLEDLEPRVQEFTKAYDGDADMLGHVFLRSFQSLSKRRSRIIGGIGDFSLSQIALAKKIDGARLEMDAALAAEPPDYNRADLLEEQLDWDQLIFTDRQRNIRYLCETPTLLERRLFGIAQMLQRGVRDPG